MSARDSARSLDVGATSMPARRCRSASSRRPRWSQATAAMIRALAGAGARRVDPDHLLGPTQRIGRPADEPGRGHQALPQADLHRLVRRRGEGQHLLVGGDRLVVAVLAIDQRFLRLELEERRVRIVGLAARGALALARRLLGPPLRRERSRELPPERGFQARRKVPPIMALLQERAKARLGLVITPGGVIVGGQHRAGAIFGPPGIGVLMTQRRRRDCRSRSPPARSSDHWGTRTNQSQCRATAPRTIRNQYWATQAESRPPPWPRARSRRRRRSTSGSRWSIGADS